MPNRAFRFVHAGDFHLEQVPWGIAEAPDQLTPLFLDAAYTAAERVFETALAEDVDFVVLSGDLLHAQYTGPRGPLFLIEQFARLAKKRIAVYWAGGAVDPADAWPSAMPLPENTHVFPRGRVEEFVHRRDGLPIARIAGIGHDGNHAFALNDFTPDPTGLFTIAAAFVEQEHPAAEAVGIHYWALGGWHERCTLVNSPHIVHYPGTQQGRHPGEIGAHGCTLVQVDEQGQARTSFIPTDPMRWLSQRVEVDESTAQADLETKLRERLRALIDDMPNKVLLISWTIAGDGLLLSQLRRGNLAAELLTALRNEFARSAQAAWSVSMDVVSASAPPAQWYEQETIRGDFLRAIRQFELDESQPLGLDSYVNAEYLAGPLAPLVAIESPAARQRALREAALLGADLLTGE
jgi:DNA repair protein SbcD/Mre11